MPSKMFKKKKGKETFSLRCRILHKKRRRKAFLDLLVSPSIQEPRTRFVRNLSRDSLHCTRTYPTLISFKSSISSLVAIYSSLETSYFAAKSRLCVHKLVKSFSRIGGKFHKVEVSLSLLISRTDEKRDFISTLRDVLVFITAQFCGSRVS